ncbi:hypothetical protein HG530_010482 [Fusarium avenaceum]|nr:hypothetical protein HG530_010482 [Fusarium avenaceum]
MAEALGVIASVATIASLAKPTVKLAKSLRSIAKHEDPIANAIRRIAAQIEVSATTVDIAVQRLKGNCSTLQKMPHASTGILQYVNKNKSLDVLIRGTEAVARQLKDAQHGLKSMGGQHAFLKRCKWYIWNKMELDSLFPDMHLLGLCLSFVCPILEMEIHQYIKQRSSTEDKEVMEEQIKSLRRELKISEDQYRKLRDDRDFVTNYGPGFDAEFQSIAAPLLRLAQSMRRTGHVPQTTEAPSQIPFGSRGPTPERQRRTRTGDRRSQGHQVEVDFTVPPRQSDKDRDPTRRRRTPSILSVSEVHITPLNHESRDVVPPRKPSTPSSQQSSTARDSGSSLASPSLQTPQTPRTPQTPNTIQTLNMPESLRTSSSQKAKKKNTYTLRSGFLRKGLHEKYITAAIDTTVQDNFISMKQATELGLFTQDLEQQDLDYIQQQNWPSRANIVGKVSGLEWRRREWSKYIPVDLWVEERYPQTGEHMVLGKSVGFFNRQKEVFALKMVLNLSFEPLKREQLQIPDAILFSQRIHFGV